MTNALLPLFDKMDLKGRQQELQNFMMMMTVQLKAKLQKLCLGQKAGTIL